MNIYEKLQNARDLIKKSNLTKAGRNDFSKYDYYTPEQVNKLVQDASKEVKIIDKFDLLKDEFGMFGKLTLIDLENIENVIVFEQRTDIPTITATNIAQQIGGSVTYTNRYMLMTAFDIKDNNLDFDTPQKKKITTTTKTETKKDDELTPDGKQKGWLNEKDIDKVVTGAKEKGFEAKDLRKYYKISKDNFAILETKMEDK